jgi:hypothetical protein
MSFLGRRPPKGDVSPADTDALQLAEEAVPTVNRANGAGWYDDFANDADRAVVALCRLRRATAGRRGDSVAGDEAVRLALGQADPEAVVWLASRAISYMDEQGYPETLGPWLGE